MTNEEYNERKLLIYKLIDAHDKWWECTDECDDELYAEYQRLMDEIIERMK